MFGSRRDLKQITQSVVMFASHVYMTGVALYPSVVDRNVFVLYVLCIHQMYNRIICKIVIEWRSNREMR